LAGRFGQKLARCGDTIAGRVIYHSKILPEILPGFSKGIAQSLANGITTGA
jgi:hypothetical protein